jgi:bifunctional enzyme CysN/CysC
VSDPVAARTSFVVVGHVDHGKSTLVGRLLADTGALPDTALERVRRICEEQAKPFEYAFLLDALEEEQAQGVTIDVTRARFSWDGRDYLFIDAPGHREFIRNMISGAAHADAALLLIDALDGVQEQSRRHAYLASFLGVRSILVLVNKMDLVAYSADRFQAIATDYRAFLESIDVAPVAILPVAARAGDNVVAPSPRLPWWDGPSVVEALATVRAAAPVATKTMRMSVQAVMKFDDRRIIAGRLDSGGLAAGDEVQVWPSGQRTHVKSIETWPETTPVTAATHGESVGLTLEDQLFIQRGDLLTHPETPPSISSVIRANVLWMGRQPLQGGQRYRLRLATLERDVAVLSITRGLDSASMEMYEGRDQIGQNDVGEVILRAARPMMFDAASELPLTGRFVLQDGYDLVGGGIILDDQDLYRRPYGPDLPRSEQIGSVAAGVNGDERARAYGHRAHVVWLTGVPGAGKSTLARNLERRLFREGVKTFVIDGEQLRFGLSADLRFTDADRSEQARRAAEVAHLFQRAGLVVIVALVSPFGTDREYGRALIGADEFSLVHLHAPLSILRQRERHGLYATAERDASVRLPGLNAPYEPPGPDCLSFDTSAMDPQAVSDAVAEHVLRRIM